MDFPFKGVAGLRQWLFSLPELYAAGHEMAFHQPKNGGIWLQLKDSNEQIPVEFVDGTHFRLLLHADTGKQLSMRQKQEANYRTHVLTANLDERYLSETKRRNLVRNFDFHPGGRAVFRWQRTLAKNPLGVAPDMYTPKCAPQRAPRSGAASQARFASARALGAGNSQVPPSCAPIILHKTKTKQNPLWYAPSPNSNFDALHFGVSFFAQSTLCKFLGKLVSSFLLF